MNFNLKVSEIIKLSQTGNASFSAFRANRSSYDGLLNPVIGFDVFRLSSDVFGPHQHRHMSALSYLFDDSAPYHNQDSIGSDLTISTGSLLWTWAGSGVTHHEFPEKDNMDIHGLQLFLEIPSGTRNLPPKSVYIDNKEMPQKEEDGVKIKVVSGKTGNLINNKQTPEPLTFLDIKMKADKTFEHVLPKDWSGTVYILSGNVLLTADENFELNSQDTIAFGRASVDVPVRFTARTECQLLFISGMPVS